MTKRPRAPREAFRDVLAIFLKDSERAMLMSATLFKGSQLPFFRDLSRQSCDDSPSVCLLGIPGAADGMETQEADDSCSLRDVSEGQIGKLVVRKSGKIQLVLGKVTLDVTMGTTCSFLQELVSVSVGEARSGEMMVLGHVQHKLVCSPDFASLLEGRHR
ncbi:DNA-directed RNA polymerase III subunit RPC4 [Pelobates cultripes]|uniref:DNA-directed RNA polymerase III subunit RPC4 n=1 Tax=Pelobates cultripes TaxID=61616 RepID=A0AAD1RAD7_PELCU|nr:DNA-directed RNA polymerase III subunit RPC4 [Pelobates cultripes]